MRKLVLMLALAAVPAQAQDLERWELTSPRVSLRFNAGLMRDLGITLRPAGRLDRDGYVSYDLGAQGRLLAQAPGSMFRTVDLGELRLLNGPVLAWRGGSISLRDARLQPGAIEGTYVIRGGDGAVLFDADHQHFSVDRAARTLRLFNIDVRLSGETASRLREPRHEGLSVAVLEIGARASIPRGSKEQPFGQCVTPNWGNPDNDVALINMSQVSQVALGSGFVAIAPSAVLKNVGVTEVPWISKFSAPQPPYNNDQHPYLVWNMYRVADGRLEQIGASGLKHAFLTLNSNCGCPSGSILWVNCEDTYGVSTNNSTGSLSPRGEITAHTGVWQRCGSIFDPDCNGIQNSVPGFSGPADPRRLAVLETDMQVPGAQYYFESWYVVRDDTNIFNGMAYRTVTPTFGGATWSFSPIGPHTNGPVIDAWVNPLSPGPNADTRRVNTGRGHLTAAVRTTDLGAGRWRYVYAISNHDFDDMIGTVSVPLPTGVTVTNAAFHDADRDPKTDWVTKIVPGDSISWSAPTSPLTPAAFGQDWGMLYTFSFEVDAAPVAQSAISLSPVESRPATPFGVQIMGPPK